MRIFRSPLVALGSVLLFGILLRLPVLIFEEQVGPDLQEYLNIGRSLREGRGFLLDIKAYYAIESSVLHDGLFVRPPLLPVLFSGLGHFMSDRLMVKCLGPVLLMLAVILGFDMLRRLVGVKAAWLASCIFASHPALLEISIRSQSEILVLCLVLLALWSRFALRWGALCGLAAGLLFLARPNAIIPGLIIVFSFLGERTGKRRVVPALVMLLFGPMAMIGLNLQSGVEPLRLPQSFLLRLMSFQDQLRYFHHGRLYESTGALLAENWMSVARTMARHAFHYGRLLLAPMQGLGYFIVLIPLAVLGVRRSTIRIQGGVVAAVVAWELAFHSALWPTFSERFLAVPVALLALGLPAGVFAWRPSVEGRWDSRSRSLLPVLLLAPIVVAFAGADLYRGYVAFREGQLGRPLTAAYDEYWGRGDVGEILGSLPKTGNVVVASNEPWLVSRVTHCPAFLLPWDLRAGEWLRFIAHYDATHVFLHESAWSSQESKNLEELKLILNASPEWEAAAQGQGLSLWRRVIPVPSSNQ